MTVEELIKTYKASGDAAYGDYIAIMSRDVCQGVDYKIEHGKFGQEELRAHNSAREALGKHRACVAFVQALKSLQPVSQGSKAMSEDIKLRQLAGERVEARMTFFLTQFGPAEVLKMGDVKAIAALARTIAFEEFSPKQS